MIIVTHAGPRQPLKPRFETLLMTSNLHNHVDFITISEFNQKMIDLNVIWYTYSRDRVVQ